MMAPVDHQPSTIGQTVLVTSTLIKLSSTVGIKLISHIDMKNLFQPFFSQPFFFINVVASGHFLYTFLTSYWPHVLMSTWYLQYDIVTVSKLGLLWLCHDTDQHLTPIWGSSAWWAVFLGLCPDTDQQLTPIWGSSAWWAVFFSCWKLEAVTVCVVGERRGNTPHNHSRRHFRFYFSPPPRGLRRALCRVENTYEV